MDTPPANTFTTPPQFAKSPLHDRYDAVIIGSGPNGLAAGITLAERGRRVLIVEARHEIGGGTRTAELTQPGFLHDVCSAVHPLAVASPCFSQWDLAKHGLQWKWPPIAFAQPQLDGPAAVCYQDLDATCEALGNDGPAWRKAFSYFTKNAADLLQQNLGPFSFPRRPWMMTRFGWAAVQSAVGFAKRRFRKESTRGLFAGMAAHSVLPLEQKLTAAVGLMLGISAHHVGWPVAVGGSAAIANALAGCFQEHGGEIVVDFPVDRMDQLPQAKAYLFDTSPRTLSSVVGELLPEKYHRKLNRFRYGPGVFKVDWALAEPVPWTDPRCLQAGTLHVGGTVADVAQAERAAWNNEVCEEPFLLVAQQSLFDDTRAPAGQHTLWGYCHVPHGSDVDMTDRIEAQIERFAPGFRERILARHVTTPRDYAAYNANFIGGDITGGVMDARQIFTRPVSLWNPYATPHAKLFLCSSSTPPGGGVHGMCGWHAAQAALKSALKD